MLIIEESGYHFNLELDNKTTRYFTKENIQFSYYTFNYKWTYNGYLGFWMYSFEWYYNGKECKC